MNVVRATVPLAVSNCPISERLRRNRAVRPGDDAAGNGENDST
jgi:hypothetical protein